MRIAEKMLVLPALYVIDAKGEASTTEIKEALIVAMHPTGEDAEILSGRTDTKFTQIVRNLLGSHYDVNGMKLYTRKRTSGQKSIFSLTAEGKAFLEKNRGSLSYIFDNTFQYDDVQTVLTAVDTVQGKKKDLYAYNEKDMVSEGKIAKKDTVVRKRSKKLRDAAIAYYTKPDGKIYCAACGFCFEDMYHDRGNGFIEIHHEKPLYQFSTDGFETYVGEAIQNMKPVCSNCHRMLHRGESTITVDELKQIIQR